MRFFPKQKLHWWVFCKNSPSDLNWENELRVKKNPGSMTGWDRISWIFLQKRFDRKMRKNGHLPLIVMMRVRIPSLHWQLLMNITCNEKKVLIYIVAQSCWVELLLRKPSSLFSNRGFSISQENKQIVSVFKFLEICFCVFHNAFCWIITPGKYSKFEKQNEHCKSLMIPTGTIYM